MYVLLITPQSPLTQAELSVHTCLPTVVLDGLDTQLPLASQLRYCHF